MEVIEYYGYESNNMKESEQINRIEKIIIDWAKEANLDFVCFFKNVNYHHKSPGRKRNNQSWYGEIDLLAICDHHFIIFELKNKEGIVKGGTGHDVWEIKYHDSNEFIDQDDFFMQCSKLKYYFSQDYYPNRILAKISLPYKLRPDVLLVFSEGSDTANIIYHPPIKFSCEEYYKILEKINQDDKIFMKSKSHYVKAKDIMKISCGKELADEERLKRILDFCGYEYRVPKWFHALAENEIKQLLPKLGSDSFKFNKEIINIMVKDFKLRFSNEYCV